MTKTLTPAAWATRAAASDKMAAPALAGISVSANGTAVASDRHRLHCVRSSGLAEGLRHAKTGAPLDYTFPQTRPLFPAEAHHYVAATDDLPHLFATVAAAVAYQKAIGDKDGVRCFVVLPSPEGATYVRPDYVADALAGSDGDVEFFTTTPGHPIVFQHTFGDRYGLIMPVRVPDSPGWDRGRFDLTSALIDRGPVALSFTPLDGMTLAPVVVALDRAS